MGLRASALSMDLGSAVDLCLTLESEPLFCDILSGVLISGD